MTELSSGDKDAATVSFWKALVSGGIAGTTVDVALFPLDTIKTRLQSPQGFLKSGGFKGVYKGLGAAALGSAPGASLFFSTYEFMKQELGPRKLLPESGVHMVAASVGEIMACLVRVPTEVVKQRMQAGLTPSMISTIQSVMATDGVSGLYKGFGITLMREIPFSLVQFPLYEKMKSSIASMTGRPAQSHESAICGSISGGIAAAVTTPLDVIKTRLMLGADAKGVPYKNAFDTFVRVVAEGETAQGSTRVLFSGVGPRVMWISIGGFVFFGAYEKAKYLLKWLS